MQDVVTYVVIGLCVVLVVWRAVRFARRRGTDCGCGGCDGCGKKNHCEKQ